MTYAAYRLPSLAIQDAVPISHSNSMSRRTYGRADHTYTYASLPRWQRMHLNPAHPRGRPDNVRTS